MIRSSSFGLGILGAPEGGPAQPRQMLSRRLVPFVLVGALVISVAVISATGPIHAVSLAAAGCCAALLLASMYALTSPTVPAWQRMITPVGWLVVVYLLEGAFGGGDITRLVLLPVVWYALYGTNREFIVVMAAAPIAVFAPHLTGVYASGAGQHSFDEAAILTLVATLVGIVVHALVRELSEHAQLQRTSAAVAHRLLVDDLDTRHEVCAAASKIGDASLAWLVEPDRQGGLVLTARVGPGPDSHRWSLTDDRSGAVHAYLTGRRRFVADAPRATGLKQSLVEMTGARSILFEPVKRDDRSVAVLLVAWKRRVPDLSAPLTAAAALLAAEAAIALERTDRVRDLRDARNEAEQTRDSMDDLLAHVSHDLRTPLTAILGFAEVARSGRLDHKSGPAVDRIRAAAEHMLSLVQGMLKQRWIEQSSEIPELIAVSVADTVAAAFTLVEERARADRIDLRGPVEDLCVIANPEQLQEVVVNLVENAIQYGEQGGRVVVTAKPAASGRRVEIAVADNGPGIPEEQLPRLFDAYTRFGDPDQRRGTGLGLAACHAAVGRMSGTIAVESELGVGTCFTIILPASLAAPPPPVQGSPPPLSSNRSVLAALTALGVTLLYIEDDATNRLLLEALLEDFEGLEVIEAETGERGVELARELLPDAILIDLSLPGMSGSEVLDELKADPETSAIPAAILSASAELDGGSVLSLPAASGFLSKPYDFDDLLVLIASLLVCTPGGTDLVSGPTAPGEAAERRAGTIAP